MGSVVDDVEIAVGVDTEGLRAWRRGGCGRGEGLPSVRDPGLEEPVESLVELSGSN